MKRVIVTTVLSLSAFLIASDAPELTYAPAQVHEVVYKITFTRDKVYDQETWDKLVTQASFAIKQAKLFENDPTAATNEIVDAFVNGIKEVYAQGQAHPQGIQGTMSIEISDSFDNGDKK